jgi:hypothetical protein
MTLLAASAEPVHAAEPVAIRDEVRYVMSANELAEEFAVFADDAAEWAEATLPAAAASWPPASSD